VPGDRALRLVRFFLFFILPSNFLPLRFASCIDSSHRKRSVNSIAWSPDGKTIVSASEDETIKVWEVSTGKWQCQSTLTVDSGVNSVAYSPSGHTIAVGCGCGKVLLVDVVAVAVKRSLSGHSRIVSCLAFKPDDPNILVSGSWDKTLKIWDLSTAACLSTVRGHNGKDGCSCDCYSWGDLKRSVNPECPVPVNAHSNSVRK
jgi:WD40 repeat protein